MTPNQQQQTSEALFTLGLRHSGVTHHRQEKVRSYYKLEASCMTTSIGSQ